MSRFRPAPLLPFLLLLCCFPATVAQSAETPLARPWPETLLLEAGSFLPLSDANPAVLQHPAASAIATHWPEGVTLRAYQYGASDPATSRKVMLVGGIHGDEAVSYLFPELLHRQLEDEAAYGITDGLLQQLADAGVQLTIVPLLNPYGTLAGLRTNFRAPSDEERYLDDLGDTWTTRPAWWLRRRGVDLNRNFPVNLQSGGDLLCRPDGEGTHQWDATGGCHQQELYYGGLLDWGGTQPEPANQWLLRLVQEIRPDVLVALHQEARVMYVDSREATIYAAPRWAPFIEAMHTAFNEPVDVRDNRRVTFGIRADGTRVDAARCVNDFSPGGYGAALSLFAGVVLTLEMTDSHVDAETDACWFPEGLLATYTDTLEIPSLRNVERLDALLSRFRGPLLAWMLSLDAAVPERFLLPLDHARLGERYVLPREELDQYAAR